MGAEKDTDFKIVVETTNQEYTNGQDALVHNLAGRGYVMFVMNKGGLQILRHGAVHEEKLAEAVVHVFNEMNARFKLLAALTVDLENIDMEHQIVMGMVGMVRTAADDLKGVILNNIKAQKAKAKE